MKERVWRDLEYLGFQQDQLRCRPQQILDVAIIGAGQSGLSLSLALWMQNIQNFAIFDCAKAGEEGPWLTTARMNVLRSPKEIPGPALSLPHLTYRHWYEEKYGENWKKLSKVPTRLWGEYLLWYRRALEIPVKNGWHLHKIQPGKQYFTLHFNRERKVRARRIVLVTGRDGGGGFQIPDFMLGVPKSKWVHTGERFDHSITRGKRVCVIGSAASAFDAAATALEEGAKRVDMLMRRDELPQKHLFALFPYWPSYYFLGDRRRLDYFQEACETGIPIPPESLKRIKKWKNFRLHPEQTVVRISEDLHIEMSNGEMEADLIILATGYKIDLNGIPFLSPFVHRILLWGDREKSLEAKFARFPYLGDRFQFMEKIPGTAPFLSKIYCFNYASFLSHGRIAGDIDQMTYGIERLAEGIAIDRVIETF